MTYNYTDWGPWGCDHRKLLEFSIALEQGGLVVKNLPAMQETGRRCGFDPWIRKILWRRKWQPTPVFLPRKSHEPRSLKGYSPQGHKELDTTEQLTLSLFHFPVVVAHGLSCSVTCEILPDQGSNQHPLHCKTDSQPPDH